MCGYSQGVVFPEDVSVRPVHMFFDKQKPGSALLIAAAAQAGLQMDKGKLIGSPERLNIFTVEGDILRLDLEVRCVLRPCLLSVQCWAHVLATVSTLTQIEAHLGSTLHPGTLNLEQLKGVLLTRSTPSTFKNGTAKRLRSPCSECHDCCRHSSPRLHLFHLLLVHCALVSICACFTACLLICFGSAGDTIVLEKGNRLSEARLQTVRSIR